MDLLLQLLPNIPNALPATILAYQVSLPLVPMMPKTVKDY